MHLHGALLNELHWQFPLPHCHYFDSLYNKIQAYISSNNSQKRSSVKIVEPVGLFYSVTPDRQTDKVFPPHQLAVSCSVYKAFSINSHWTIGLSIRFWARFIVPARLLRSWVRIPPGARIFVCCECRVMSCRGLCDELITRPEESYRLCCVVVCDLETPRIAAPYIYDIRSLRVNDLTLILLMWRKWWANNVSK
jgi:hypothetical protein